MKGRKNGQPVTSDTIRNKAKELAKVLNIPNQEFKGRLISATPYNNMPKVSRGF